MCWRLCVSVWGRLPVASWLMLSWSSCCAGLPEGSRTLLLMSAKNTAEIRSSYACKMLLTLKLLYKSHNGVYDLKFMELKTILLADTIDFISWFFPASFVLYWVCVKFVLCTCVCCGTGQLNHTACWEQAPPNMLWQLLILHWKQLGPGCHLSQLGPQHSDLSQHYTGKTQSFKWKTLKTLEHHYNTLKHI